MIILKYKAIFYTILDDEIYKYISIWNLERCLGEKKAYTNLVEVHESICEAHQPRENMMWVLKQQRLFFSYYGYGLLQVC